MKPADIAGGILRQELFIGVASSVTARTVGVNLSEAGRPSGSHFAGARYGRGEVGEFVLIEGQQSLLLGRIAEVRVREGERRLLNRDFSGAFDFDAIGQIQLLGCVEMDTLRVTAGVDSYSRLGDRIYAAPHRFIALLPRLMERDAPEGPITINLGTVGGNADSPVHLMPERLFGRHCAILGATGGGKSWTTARIIEECLRHRARLILVDATGEYRTIEGPNVRHYHLGDPVSPNSGSTSCCLPPTSFTESDFIALFEPAGKVQGPRLRAAIRSLRLARIRPELAPAGFIPKINQPKGDVQRAEADVEVSKRLDDPSEPFDPTFLVRQIEEECVWPDGWHPTRRGEKDPSRWGDSDGNFSHCLSLVARINGVLTSPSFACVFDGRGTPSLTGKIVSHLQGDPGLLRIDLSGIGYEFQAREIIANVIGRSLLLSARAGQFRDRPTVVIVDEAHNFLGRRLGGDEYGSSLDAFELIAKEGRKFGLSLCLSTQRPRDVTEGVLSQMGTLVVHRLTNDRDREVVERACGEIDRAAAAFLPNLRPGEAAIIGADFPIPLTLHVRPPMMPPRSDGPDFQVNWANPAS